MPDVQGKSSDVAAMKYKILLMMTALHDAVRTVEAQGPSAPSAPLAHTILAQLVSTWHEIKAAQAAHEAEEAELFKSKPRAVDIRTEEVTGPLLF